MNNLWPKADIILDKHPLGYQAITVYWQWTPTSDCLCLKRLVSEPEWRLRRANLLMWLNEMLYNQ